MKKITIFLATIMCIAFAQAQITTYSDANIEAQLVAVKGDSVNGTLHPVLRLRSKGSSEIHLTRPQAWTVAGFVCENNQWDNDMTTSHCPFWEVNVDKDIWVKTNLDEYFRIEEWPTYKDTISVLRIEYQTRRPFNDYQHHNIHGAIAFYDVPIEWGTPENLPTNFSHQFGLKPLDKNIGVYHYFKDRKETFNGSLRLEAVAGDIKTGQLVFIMQVKSNGATSVFSDAITIKYKGELITFRGRTKNKYDIVPNQWCEVAIVGESGSPVLVHPSTKKIRYLEMQIGNSWENGTYIAHNVPIQWIDFNNANSTSATANTTSSSPTITSKGVGPLQLGKKFPLPTPKGTFYTSAKKLTADKYSGINYGLYNGSKLVGDVMADFTTQAIKNITIKTSAVKMENGIAVGTKVKDALSKGGVKAEIEYDYESSSWSITFRYGNIVLVCNDTDSGLTPDANKRIKKGFYSGNLIFDLPSNFFKDSATISQIIIVNQ